MGLVFAEEADMATAVQVAEVLVQVVGRDKSLDNLVVLRLLVVAAADVLVAELDLLSSRSNNRHY